MPASVLIVDDEAMIRANLSAYLEDEGLAVTAVDSGEQALHCIGAGREFAVCIMDIRLPGIDGNTAIRRLHALRPAMRFIIHTGSSDYTLPEELYALGVDPGYIYSKPLLDMAPLAAAVRALARQQDPK